MNKNSELLIITGEVSGDLIGADLLKKLRKLNGSLKTVGIGGNKMRAEGL